MANLAQQIIGGFFSGFVAGIIGYVTDVVTGAMFEAFKPFNPMIAVLGVVFAIASFLSGIMEARTAGFFFSFGIISAGVLLSDSVTVLSGIISIAGVVISLAKKRNAEAY